MVKFEKYETMRKQGADPKKIYRAGKADGLDPVALLRLLREVCALSLTQAKEVSLIAEELADSLIDHQEKLLPAVERTLSSEETKHVPTHS